MLETQILGVIVLKKAFSVEIKSTHLCDAWCGLLVFFGRGRMSIIELLHKPIGYLVDQPNRGKYTVHGWYGKVFDLQMLSEDLGSCRRVDDLG